MPPQNILINNSVKKCQYKYQLFINNLLIRPIYLKNAKIKYSMKKDKFSWFEPTKKRLIVKFSNLVKTVYYLFTSSI